MELISLQLQTVKQILDLYNPQTKVTCEFKSPTGSGKTLMASYFISALIEHHPSEKFIFVVATPSSSSLPYFFEQKINKYKPDLPYSKFEVEYIQSPSSSKSDKNKSESIPKIMPERNKVYIFGKSSFGKGRILSEFGVIDDFVKYLVEKGYKLIYIRDEAHIGGNIANDTQAQNFENLMSGNASFVLKMTATPNMEDITTSKVILKESELNNPVLNDGKWLLKTHHIPPVEGNLDNDKILPQAIDKFKEIKKEYAQLNIGIRPAMLIQIDNDAPRDKERAQEFEETLAYIKDTLKQKQINWVQYFGNNNKDSNTVYGSNFTLDDITKNNNEVDAIIFKIGPSTGWDIPRACMLLQLRKVCSSNLNIQTLGRIKRNPYPNLERNEITDKYYTYSNIDNAANEVKEYIYKVRDKFANETFLAIDIANKKEIKDSKSNKRFAELFASWLNDRTNIILQEVNSTFINNHQTYRKILNIVNGHEIYSTITNPFIFLRDYRRFVNANKPLYDLCGQIIDDFCKKNKVQREFVSTILFNRHRKDVLDIMSKTKVRNPKYKISEQPYDPQSYQEIYSSGQQEERVSRRDYLFGINENDNNGSRQPLDSTPEIVVFNTIYNFAEDSENIKLWAKNLTSSNIFGEYLDDTLNIKKSYFDFILKFKNGFYLYIEVKGIPDINQDKTELLKKAYREYFENKVDDLFSPKLAIAVWEVDAKHFIHSSVYFDEKVIKDDLNQLSVDNLLQKLSELEA